MIPEEEMKQCCDKEFLKLLKIVMRFDSFSYQFILNPKKGLKFCKEIDKSIDEIIETHFM